MKNLIKERIAQANGVSINNKMLKKAERRDIVRKYTIIDEYTSAYNNLKDFTDNSESNLIKDWNKTKLNEFKYNINRR